MLRETWSPTHMHTPVCHYYRVPGEIKRREVELDPQPRRDHEQGGGAGLRKLDFFRLRLFVNSSGMDIVFVTLPKHSSWNSNCAVHKSPRNGEARGHHRNTSIVLVAVHGLSRLFRAVSAVEPSLFRPLPPIPQSPSLISILASVDVKQYGQTWYMWSTWAFQSAQIPPWTEHKTGQLEYNQNADYTRNTQSLCPTCFPRCVLHVLRAALPLKSLDLGVGQFGGQLFLC